MKKLTLIIGLLVAANVLLAQNKREKIRERAEVRIEEYKERLNLSEDQVADLKRLREEMKPEFEELRQDESIERTDKMRAQADLIDKRQGEVDKILNDEQLAELETIKGEVRAKRKERMERRKNRRDN